MLVIRNYFGVPSPTSGPALSIQAGDIIELIGADLQSAWWQVRGHTVSPSHDVKKWTCSIHCISSPPLSVHLTLTPTSQSAIGFESYLQSIPQKG